MQFSILILVSTCFIIVNGNGPVRPKVNVKLDDRLQFGKLNIKLLLIRLIVGDFFFVLLFEIFFPQLKIQMDKLNLF